ncbi:hypothetical protein BUALT_Bualt12G0099800 [Buddleja alternifolia]|uniref:DUF7910 domain-containing protein n=1 Tax=Buddleja alternifolia TaxID=168488 RepID=A0AAV6WUU8_9LAMI|nr:hypothetical protein BUALT_Bualt12G0099800 [Buddleja alternifolia]
MRFHLVGFILYIYIYIHTHIRNRRVKMVENIYTSSAMKLFIISFFLIIICSSMFSLSNGRSVPDDNGIVNPGAVRAVNLGGWLVTEGWIKPSLFDAIPNNDLLIASWTANVQATYSASIVDKEDGRGVQFKSVAVSKFLCAESGGGTILVANRTSASGWETFSLWRINQSSFNFRVFNRQFVGLDIAGNGIDIVAAANAPVVAETFEIQRNPDDFCRVRIKAPNGFFLQVKTEELVTADYEGNDGWGNDNPSVFILTISGRRLRGEYQLTNGYGPLLAPQIMKEHWSTFIVEEDFKYIKSNGLNAVRIPVGWWIASDPSPPKPYVAGSLQVLDNAFVWSE